MTSSEIPSTESENVLEITSYGDGTVGLETIVAIENKDGTVSYKRADTGIVVDLEKLLCELLIIKGNQ